MRDVPGHNSQYSFLLVAEANAMTQTPIKLSFEEYLTYNDETDKRYELVNGELVEIAPARGRHADIVNALDDIY